VSARLRERHRRGLSISLGWLGFSRDSIELYRVGHTGVAALAGVVVPRWSGRFADGRVQCVSCRYLRTRKVLWRHLAGGPLLARKSPWLSAV
jgi:hypothetical protein